MVVPLPMDMYPVAAVTLPVPDAFVPVHVEFVDASTELLLPTSKFVPA